MNFSDNQKPLAKAHVATEMSMQARTSSRHWARALQARGYHAKLIADR